MSSRLALLASVTTGRLDESVRRRILEEAHGNPLALRELGVVDFAGGFAMPDSVSVPRRTQDHYLTRLRGLPRATRRLVLVAAADPVGDPTLLQRAAQTLGLCIDALELAVDAGLLDIGGGVRFRHPLLWYGGARAGTAGRRRCRRRALPRRHRIVSRTRMVSHLARARLCYGEWLRRNIVVPTLARSCDAPSMSLRPWAPTPLPNAPAASSRPRAKRYAPTARAPAPD